MKQLKFHTIIDYEYAKEFVEVKLARESRFNFKSLNGQYQATFETLLNWCINCMGFSMIHDLDYINQVSYDKKNLTITFTRKP